MNIYNLYGKDFQTNNKIRENQNRGQQNWENFNRYLKYQRGADRYSPENSQFWYYPVWYYPPSQVRNGGQFENPHSHGFPSPEYSEENAESAGAPPGNEPKAANADACNNKINADIDALKAAKEEEAKIIEQVKAAAAAKEEQKEKPDGIVRSVAEFFDAVDKAYAQSGTGNGTLWFRGMESHTYTLLPPFYQKNHPGVNEQTLVSQFRTKAAPYISGFKEINLVLDDDSYISALFLMRDAGIPTRLLSFTEDALAALFFAVSGKCESGNPAVFCLNPYKLNEAYGFGVPNAAEKEVAGLFSSRENPGNLKPCAVYSPFLSADVIAQKETFTIFPLSNEIKPLESLPDSKDYLYKITIDKNMSQTIAAQLGRYGFKKENLLRSIKTVAEKIKSESAVN